MPPSSQVRESPTNLSLRAEIVDAALEPAVKEAEARWLDENRDAIEAYNARVTRRGVFSDGRRRF